MSAAVVLCSVQTLALLFACLFLLCASCLHLSLCIVQLEYYQKGGDVIPKDVMILDSSCAVSEIKELRSSGKTLYAFKVSWPENKAKEVSTAVTFGYTSLHT